MTRRPAAIDDESLIAALRLAAGRDPVPGHVPATARAAFGLRLPGAPPAPPRAAPAPGDRLASSRPAAAIVWRKT
ncbi:hypothetical protein ABZW82_32630, partial [Streptosporangium sandarakinum]